MLSGNNKINMIRRVTSFTLLAALALAAALIAPPRKSEAFGGTPSLIVVISQVYGGAGCGTANCSTYQNDFIELYNRAKSPVSLNGWSVQYAAATGTAWQVTALPNVTLQPGQYFLIAESFGANGTSPLPTPDFTPVMTIAMSATAAKVALVNTTTALTGACPAAAPIIDFVGYGTTANCSETANAPAPSTTTADVRAAGGNTDTDNNSADFQALAPTPRNTSSTANTPTAANGLVSGRVADSSGAPITGAVVRMSGTQARKTITDAHGDYYFDNVETNGFYTVAPSQANFSFSPAERSFSQIGNSTEATFIANPSGGFVNNLDSPEYFVRQQYLDFLGREPDESGFNFWSNQLLECGSDAVCSERRTVNVSAAYFLSGEFQQTGGLVDRLYKASFGRNPLYAEFMPDTAAVAGGVVVGRNGWQMRLATNKESFVADWIARPDFRAAFDNLSNDSYVEMLVRNTGASFAQSDRDSLVSGLNAGTLSRADALQQIAANENFVRARYNQAFVMMEYFGYLRRDPDAAGYQFWLDKLNQFDGNFERADMVKSFIVSGEYRARFAK
jgi:hypothetical protein